MKILAPCFIFAVALITVCCLVFVKSEPLTIEDSEVRLPKARTIIYLALFLLSILIVFRGIDYRIGLVIIFVALMILDRHALKKVDYPLLLTFVFFFIFAGNMARIGVIREFLGMLLEKNTLVFSILSCQVISNVPSAILLSQFTGNYADLLLGVNIGGVGTLISSLASLITFREYTKHNPGKAGYYILMFSALNFVFLILLAAFALIF
jgi:di/tricarboxylate transporter